MCGGSTPSRGPRRAGEGNQSVGRKSRRHVPSPVSMSSALPYFGAVRDVVEPCGLSTCMECSEVYVVTSGGAE